MKPRRTATMGVAGESALGSGSAQQATRSPSSTGVSLFLGGRFPQRHGVTPED